MPAFRAIANTTQTLISGGTEVNFGTTVFDPEGNFSTSRFTLPDSWLNKRVRFWAGIRLTGSLSALTLTIEYSENGGSSWLIMAQSSYIDQAFSMTVVSPARAYSVSGTLFRVVASQGAGTASGTQTTFFAGALIAEQIAQFEAVDLTISTSSSVATTAFVPTDFDTLIDQTSPLHDAAGGQIRLPVDSPSFLVEASAAHSVASFGYFGTYLLQSTDGTNYGTGTNVSSQDTCGDNAAGNCASGVFLMEPGDRLRVSSFNNGGNTINVSDRTTLNARLWRYEIPFAPYAHYDLSQDDYTVSTTNITVIPDQTPNGRNLNTTVSSAWPQDGRTINGLSAAEFVGSADGIFGTGFTAFENADQPFTVVAVIDVDDVSTFHHMFGFHTASVDEYQSFFINNNNTPSDWGASKRDTGGVTFTVNSTFAAATGPAVIIYQSTGTQISAWVNGEKILQSSAYDRGAMTGVNRFCLGNVIFNGALLLGFDGAIGELILYNRALSYGDCRVLTNVLATKWGVTNVIDSGHRYWRLKGTVAGSFDGGALTEIEFYSSVGNKDVTVQGTPISGSEAFGGTDDQAFDGEKFSSFWAGNNGAVAAGTSWVGYDFGPLFKPNIVQFEITARASSNSNQVWDQWNLEYSDDGTTWIVADSFVDTASWAPSESRKYVV